MDIIPASRASVPPFQESPGRQRPHSAIFHRFQSHGTALNGLRTQGDVFYTPKPQRVISNGGQAQIVSVGSSRPTISNQDDSPATSAAKSISRAQSSRSTPESNAMTARIVVGVDFGTTYSGVAIAHSSTPEDVDIIKTWPGGNNITSDKVPTELSYEPAPSYLKKPEAVPDIMTASPTRLAIKPASKDSAMPVRWGFQLKPEEPRLRCLKLYFDRNQQLPNYISPLDTATQLKKHGRTVMNGVTDYLAQLYEHTMDTLRRRYGANLIDETAVEFVLTVPAVWSDAAKNATLLAAERAGMGSRHDLKLISEPEAAALYTLKTFLPTFIKVGHNIIVCDAGGGTVDIIAYRVTQKSPLRIDESVVGTGSLCGSSFLNYRFEDHVRVRLGEARYNEMREKKSKTWQIGLKYFEEIVKRNFTEDDPQEFYVPFPGLADDDEAGLDGGFLTMSPQQVKEIFDPIVDQVTNLLQIQVDAIRNRQETVTAAILVGGFGESSYLHSRLSSHFASSPPSGNEESWDAFSMTVQEPLEIMQPVHAWTAVVRGAVLCGLEGSIVQHRRSRWHYGTSYASVYSEVKHPIGDRYWSPLWERWMVSDRMQWHIAKGEQISERKPISFHYTRNFQWGSSLVVEDELYGCEADEAPDVYKKDLIPICTLYTDLSAVPKDLFHRFTTTNGVEFDNLDFSLDMTLDSASLVFQLKVGGIPYGQVITEFH